MRELGIEKDLVRSTIPQLVKFPNGHNYLGLPLQPSQAHWQAGSWKASRTMGFKPAEGVPAT